jgi:sialic acid synthase SpsE
MQIGTRTISYESGPYVIAELGVNHDGSVDRAISLVDAAAGAGADAVKLQLFRAELLTSASSGLAAYQRDAGEEDPVRMLSRLELSLSDMARVAEHARRRRLHAIVTPFTTELVGEADAIGWDAYKVASPDIIHRPLLERLALTGRPLILSTGAAQPAEIVRAAGWLAGVSERVAFLQCVSSYPTPPECASLAGIGALLAMGLHRVGYSDHTTGVHTGALAVAAGACVLEKHLTYDTGARGPDHSASLDPARFGQYVEKARSAFAMMGPAAKRVLPIESDVRTLSRQSVVAARDLAVGALVSAQDLTVRRPGTGFPPFVLRDLVGRRVLRAVAAGTPLTPEHVDVDDGRKG